VKNVVVVDGIVVEIEIECLWLLKREEKKKEKRSFFLFVVRRKEIFLFYYFCVCVARFFCLF